MKFITQGVTLGTHPSRKLSKHDEFERHKTAEEKYDKVNELTSRKQTGQFQFDKMNINHFFNVRPCLMDHQSLLKEIFLKGLLSFLENISNKHPQITMNFTCFIWSIPSNSYEISL